MTKAGEDDEAVEVEEDAEPAMKAHQRVYIPLRRIFRRNQYNKSNNETSFRPI
jgi:hypothetical protein